MLKVVDFIQKRYLREFIVVCEKFNFIIISDFKKQLRCKRSSRSNFILKAEWFLEAIALYDRRHVPGSKVRFDLFLMFSVNA